MRKPSAVIFGVTATCLLGGCCHCLKPAAIDTRPLPPAITLEQQLEALNARASALPRLKAEAESGGVEVYSVQNGKPHHDSADGTILIEQHYADHSANVFMHAKVLGQAAFELGKNDKVQWYIAYGDKPRAGVVPAGEPLALWAGDEETDAEKQGGELLRAELIPQLLAITEIVPASDERVVMRVDDLHGTNDLLIEHVQKGEPAGGESGSGAGTTALEREIVIDRRSGEVREVDLFGPGGVILVHASLDAYAPVRGGAGGVSMPRHIVIDQPSTHTRIGLTLATWTMPTTFKAAAFETPDWDDLGITPTQGE